MSKLQIQIETARHNAQQAEDIIWVEAVAALGEERAGNVSHDNWQRLVTEAVASHRELCQSLGWDECSCKKEEEQK